MNKKSIVFVCACAFFVGSCQKNPVVKLTGEIINSGNKWLQVVDDKLNIAADTIVLTDGTFVRYLKIEKPAFRAIASDYWYQEFFLAPGYSLNISFDTEHIDSTYKLTGKGAEENRIHDSIMILTNNLDYDYVYSQPFDLSIRKIDSIFNGIQKTMDHLILSKNIDPLYIEYEKASLIYNASFVKIISGIIHEVKDSASYSFLNSIDIENEKYLDIPNYRTFLEIYINYKKDQVMAKDTSLKYNGDDYLLADLSATETINDKNIFEYLMYNSIYQHLKYYGADRSEQYIEYFKEHNKDTIYSRLINGLYEKKLLLASGNQAPLFSCSDAHGKMVSLGDFKNKIVYIDFWATWCGPCLYELPYYIELQSEYRGKDIVFISISLDDNRDDWMKKIAEEKSEAINVFGGNGWNSEASKLYQVSAIPTFVLIDFDGTIIAAQAPRPSSDQIRPMLDSLLAGK